MHTGVAGCITVMISSGRECDGHFFCLRSPRDCFLLYAYVTSFKFYHSPCRLLSLSSPSLSLSSESQIRRTPSFVAFWNLSTVVMRWICPVGPSGWYSGGTQGASLSQPMWECSRDYMRSMFTGRSVALGRLYSICK